MRFLRQNTATRVTVGPFLDKTDGITPEVALTATNEKITLMVDTGGVPTLVIDATATASAGDNDLVHVTNDDAGFYDLELTAAQTNYVGRAMLSINYVTDHCPVFHEFTILPANVYDSLLGTDKLDVNAAELGGTSQTGRDIGSSVLLSAGTGTGQIALTSGAVTVGTNSDKTGYSLATAPPTAAQIDTQLSSTHGAGLWGAAAGSGSTSTTLTITVSSVARDGVSVWVTTDSAGTNTVASGTTNAFGQVTFLLDPGTYYAWKSLSGVNFTNPETFTVT